MFQQRRRNDQRNLGVYLLAYQMFSSGPIPPVTMGAIALQVAIYLGYLPQLAMKHTRSLCLLPHRVLEGGEWYRLLAPVVMHADDMHLYYNMVSLLWKGRHLENKFGPVRFATILGLFSVATTAMTVAVSYLLDEVLDGGYMYQCAVGFSGVLFALKVLVNSYFPDGDQRILGWLPVPSKYACWAELVIIQVLSPNVSFVGHLSGILVGLLYTMGPLRYLTDIICGVAAIGNGYGNGPSAPTMEDSDSDEVPGSNRMFSGRGATTGGGGPTRYESYTGGLSEEEQMRRATEESLRHRRPYGWN